MTITKSTPNILYQYQNGDFLITLYNDGTLTKESNKENPQLETPSSIDIKITDYCDMGCSFCHESSTEAGKHGDLNFLLDNLELLLPGTEVALGGGNPLSHPNLIPFLKKLKERDVVVNLTINQGHLFSYKELIDEIIDENLAYGIGISITSKNYAQIKYLLNRTPNLVFHVIAGIHSPQIIDELMNLGDYCKILVLGYKDWGFGLDYRNEKVNGCINQWLWQIHSYLNKKNLILSFDNLGIEQLNMRRFFKNEEWGIFFMGEDFSHTMYIDAVKQEYAPTSRSPLRTSMKNCSLKEFFDTRLVFNC